MAYSRLPAFAALAVFLTTTANAHQADNEQVRELSPVEINSKKNPGNVPYATFLKHQAFLQSLLPPEPRVIDLRLRLSFTGITGPARDTYLPDSWAVAIVGETQDQTIPVDRGGYFLLPNNEQAAREQATLMFNTQTRKGYVNVAWKLRLREGQMLPYADFAKAFDEVKRVQQQIPWYRISMYDERVARFDGLKACFFTGEGRIEIGGQPAAARTEGMCQVIRFDPALAGVDRNDIAFIGQLDTVTLHDAAR
ncbi:MULTISPECIES: hypothetical protein [unclassified Massilia]|uniref:hypothetical protein n=1 Tax=unclassified Massilia TaxID=2609279 RepID=UPI001B82F974|nr:MULTISPECIES: hypothetical protein [unclassified Massilia]MBQ5940267.1 hypothetical protein [Massilia sp. AB1]MBQ5962735.1 hypothetical protein [Massilia sp. ZL223]